MLHFDDALELMARAIELFRAVGDRPREAIATSYLATWQSDLAHPDEALKTTERAWSEFSDLAETEAGARLMVAFSRAYGSTNDNGQAILWGERAAIVAERLDLTEIIVRSLHTRGSAMVTSNRAIEGAILIRGAGELAQSHGLLDAETRWRTLSTFLAQWDDPRAGLESARAGQALAERVGSRNLSMQMVGNGVSCATRVGEWDWAAELLREWAAVEVPTNVRIELTADAAILDALRGVDPTEQLASVEALIVGLSDPQFDSYRQVATAWAALASGRLSEAQVAGRSAAETTGYFAPVAWPLAARAALWDRDVEAGRDLLDKLVRDSYRGSALSADILTVRAGLAALEGRPTEGLASYREALRAWQNLGLEWDEALCTIDMTTVLDPADSEVRTAAERARSILTRLDAKPMLERLELAVSRSAAVPSRPGSIPVSSERAVV